MNWEWSKAEEDFKRALDLDPNYAIAHLWYGALLLNQGRFQESLREHKRAQELDPLSLAISGNLAVFYFHQAKYDQAIEVSKKALEVDANFALAHMVWQEAIHRYPRLRQRPLNA